MLTTGVNIAVSMKVALTTDASLMVTVDAEFSVLVYDISTSMIPCSIKPNELPVYCISSILSCCIVVNSEDIWKSPTGNSRFNSPLESNV